jgi:hypothetical protein
MKTKEEVWIQFASTAISTLLASKDEGSVECLVQFSATVADSIVAQWKQRFEKDSAN